MDIEVNDLEDANTGRGGDEDAQEKEELYKHGNTEPCLGMEFESEDDAKSLYEMYAKRKGFSVRVTKYGRRYDGMFTGREFSCVKDGLKRRAGDSCEALLSVEFKSHGKWVVTRFVKEHNHSTLSSGKVHSLRSRKHFAGEAYPTVVSVPSGVVYMPPNGNHALEQGPKLVPVEPLGLVRSAMPITCLSKQSNLKKTFGGDAQNMLDYFKKMQAENPGFYYAIQLDEDNHVANVFWADAKSRSAYSHFGDTVTFDTTYRVNQYKVPFAPFTGVNHHGQTILFACALILDESEATFLWLFKTFLVAMNGRPPSSITTGQDRIIQAAVVQVFPIARHYINKWDVLRDGQERMARVCQLHPTFQVELYNCINLTQTVEEFESSWEHMVEKYDLKKNDWLQTVYSIRRQWVPVYFRDSFFAAVSVQGFESPFFEGYVNQQTTLPLFFRQYERAVENSFEKEAEADSETLCTSPDLRTPSPMEKQAANLYTRRIFTKFQEELVETFVYIANRIDGDGASSTYRVVKFEDDLKAYTVSLNLSEMKANCSCQMFEYCGILCRHILTVFTVTNVLTLPAHYILKRWTRNAKTGVVSDHGQLHAHESLTSRYNNLCREAIRYAEDGAIAPETYDLVLTALKEAGKKVAALKRTLAKVAPMSAKASGDGHRTSTAAPNMAPLLWPQKDEMIRRFNLSDGGAPTQSCDMNFPRMAPVSLHDHLDNMMVLPCLKSMTWVMENKNSPPAKRVAVINMKLQDYSRTPSWEAEVNFHLSRVTLEPMLRSMAYISEQLSTPVNKVAVINLKLQDRETTSGESEVKFQVSKETLGAMLRSMAYIREQLSVEVEAQQKNSAKKPRR